MNLLVKRTGQLAMAVALFFLSCQDEVVLQGYTNPNPKFDVNYIEIPLTSSVYLMDSIRTQNYAGSLLRGLVGKYQDPAFGNVSATSIGSILTVSSPILPADTVLYKYVYDSVYMDVRFDYYSYGTPGTKKLKFAVHEVTEILDVEVGYFAKDSPTLSIDPLGTGEYTVDPVEFQKQYGLADNAKDTAVLRIKLDNTFGKRIFKAAKTPDGLVDATFVKNIKGVAIVPDTDNDKVVGLDIFNRLDAGSNITRVTVYYHRLNQDNTMKDDSLRLGFTFGRVNFTNLTYTPTGDLSVLTVPNREEDTGDFRYVQAGTGVTTKIDLNNFFQFADTIDRMIINSAELSIDGIDDYSQYYPINSFTLRPLNEFNDFRKTRFDTVVANGIKTLVIDSRDVAVFNAHGGLLNNVGGLYALSSDVGNTAVFERDGNSFSTHIGLLAQQLYQLGDNPERLRYFSLQAIDPPDGRAVNRIRFNKNNLKLKVYYTRPVVSAQP